MLSRTLDETHWRHYSCTNNKHHLDKLFSMSRKEKPILKMDVDLKAEEFEVIKKVRKR